MSLLKNIDLNLKEKNLLTYIKNWYIDMVLHYMS